MSISSNFLFCKLAGFSENLRKKQVQNANSMQHLRHPQRISEILREMKVQNAPQANSKYFT